MNPIEPSAASIGLEAALRASKKAPATIRAHRTARIAWTDWAAIRSSVAAGVETSPSKALTMALVSVASEAGLWTSELAALKWTGPAAAWRYRRLGPAGMSGGLEAAFRASMSPATCRAYKTAWKAWTDWAAARASAFPAAESDVAEYLAHRAGQGAGMATLRMACAAISGVHRIAGKANPCGGAFVKAAMSGFARQATDQGVAAKQAKAWRRSGAASAALSKPVRAKR